MAFLFARAGLPLHRYRLSPLQRRLPACLRALRAGALAEARRRLEHDPLLITVAMNAVLIGVSQFFRDAATFAALRDTVVPELARRPGPLRIWSAACANGAELYSVGILLGSAGVLERCELLGTDCRAAAIAGARTGLYDPRLFASLPAGLGAGWLAPDGGRLRVAARLRQAACWQVEDIFQAPPRTRLDLVLCRNLAIYLRPEAAQVLWERLAADLRSDGLLVVGRAEQPALQTGLVKMGPCLYRRRE